MTIAIYGLGFVSGNITLEVEIGALTHFGDVSIGL